MCVCVCERMHTSVCVCACWHIIGMCQRVVLVLASIVIRVEFAQNSLSSHLFESCSLVYNSLCSTHKDTQKRKGCITCSFKAIHTWLPM